MEIRNSLQEILCAVLVVLFNRVRISLEDSSSTKMAYPRLDETIHPTCTETTAHLEVRPRTAMAILQADMLPDEILIPNLVLLAGQRPLGGRTKTQVFALQVVRTVT